MSKIFLERLSELPTASVSDALDSLKLPGQIIGLSRQATTQVIAGRIFTVRYETVVGDEQATVGDFLDDVSPGDVIFIDNKGRQDCTTWGGIMSQVAADGAIAGAIVNGACRDIKTSTEANFPIWSSAVFMRTGKDRVRCAEVQGTLDVSGVKVEPNDYVLADADGVLVIPQRHIEDVLQIAETIDAVEASIVEAVKAGSTLVDARKRHSYHTLQSPKANERALPA